MGIRQIAIEHGALWKDKAMNYDDALNWIIDDGEMAARRDYKPGEKLDGSLDGFAACRGKTPADLIGLYDTAVKNALAIFRANKIEKYWYWTCYAAEVEYVMNVLSNIYVLCGQVPFWPKMTARGTLKANEILSQHFKR